MFFERCDNTFRKGGFRWSYNCGLLLRKWWRNGAEILVVVLNEWQTDKLIYTHVIELPAFLAHCVRHQMFHLKVTWIEVGGIHQIKYSIRILLRIKFSFHYKNMPQNQQPQSTKYLLRSMPLRKDSRRMFDRCGNFQRSECQRKLGIRREGRGGLLPNSLSMKKRGTFTKSK